MSEPRYKAQGPLRFGARVYTRGAILPATDSPDPELRRLIDLGQVVLVLDAVSPPAKPPPPPRKAGVYVVSHPGGIQPNPHSSTLAPPGTLLWLGAEQAENLGDSVRPLNLREVLAAEPSAAPSKRASRSIGDPQ